MECSTLNPYLWRMIRLRFRSKCELTDTPTFNVVYFNTQRITDLHKEAANSFRNQHRALIAKIASRQKFIDACAKNGAHSLPRSLQLSFSERATFPTEHPELYSTERDQLRALQADTAKKVQEILLSVKQKEIDAVAALATAASYIPMATANFAKAVADDIRRYSATPALDSNIVLLHEDTLRRRFEEFLTQDINKYMMDYAEEERRKQLAAEKQRADNLAAQAAVFGNSCAENIDQIVAKKVASQTAALRRELDQLKNKKRKDAPTAPLGQAPAAAAHGSKKVVQFDPTSLQSNSTNSRGGDRPNKKAKRQGRNNDARAEE